MRRAALLLAVLLLASTAYYVVLRPSRGYTLTVMVEVPQLPNAGKLYGWIELIASAPGAKPLTKTAMIKPGARMVTVKLNTAKLVEESRRAIRSSNPQKSKLLHGKASTVTVLLSLYDSEGHHYLASAVIGSYDIALRRYGSPTRAFHAVEQNPYLVLQAGTLVVKAEAFSIVNVTGLYESIVEQYYRLPSPARQHVKANTTTTTRRLEASIPLLPYNLCTVVTMYNYRAYNLPLTSRDFIILPELYNAKTPETFKQHLQGLTSVGKERVYREFKTKFSTAVYVPASCPIQLAVYSALVQWYDPLSPHDLVGLLTLQQFWYEIAENAGIPLNPFYTAGVRWVDASTNTIQKLHNAPILRLAGICKTNCNNNIVFELDVKRTKYSYYKKGISIANLIFMGTSEGKLEIDRDVFVTLWPKELNQGYTGFITADLTIYSVADGVFIDYYVKKVTLYDRWGIPHQYWMIMPIVAFTPIQLVDINWATLSSKRVSYIYDYTEYSLLIRNYFKLLGATRANYTWINIYIQGRKDIVIDDTVGEIGYESSYAGAVVGLAELLLDQLLSVVAEGQGLITRLLSITGSLISFAYDTYGESKIVITLKATTSPQFGSAHIRVLKMVPYLGWSPRKLYFVGSRYSQQTPYPIFITYFIIYEGQP